MSCALVLKQKDQTLNNATVTQYTHLVERFDLSIHDDKLVRGKGREQGTSSFLQNVQNGVNVLVESCKGRNNTGSIARRRM